jgi:peroxiredoxin/outer membrane lipoprotein-sorting protein
MRLFLYLVLLPVSLLARPTFADQLVGSWVNQDPGTRGITQVVIRRESNDLLVHVWAKCNPVDCDWGETKITSWNSLARATYDQGFAVSGILLVPQPDGRLLLVDKREYRDQSGRPGHDDVEFFVREKPQMIDPETVAAKALLEEVAETCRNLKTARFESDQIVERISEQSVTRRTVHYKILIWQPGKLRVEATGSGEPSIRIADGETLWEVFPEANEYTRMPQATQQSFDYSPVGSYVLLDQIREPAKIVRQDRISDTDCTVVRIGREGGYTRTLWINSETGFVWKEESKEPSSQSGEPSVSRVTTYTLARAGESLAPEQFVFDPSKAQARDRLKLQQQAPLNTKGSPAPDFALRDLNGKEVRLRDLRGKAVLLDFWGTWCGPCREAMPMVELLYRQFRDKGLVVLGVDFEEPGGTREFLQKFGYTLPSLFDPNRHVHNEFEVGAFPTLVLIDKGGKIVWFKVGSGSYEELRDALRGQGIW